MFYEWLYPLRDQFFVFNVFRYITFRAVFASVTAFLICAFFGPSFILWLKKINLIASHKREHAPELEKFQEMKSQTPTMGGLIIVTAVVVANIMWGNFQNKHTVLILLVLVSLGLIGFLDDYLKISRGNSLGLSAITKLSGQILTGLFLGAYLFFDPHFENALYFPFLKTATLTLGSISIVWIMLVVVATSNALNLTDGLDGLAIGCSLFVVGSFAVISYVTGNFNFSEYLNIPYIRGSGELSVFLCFFAWSECWFPLV